MLLLVLLTRKPNEIPAPQMYRSCTDFGGHRLLTRSHFNHSVNTLGRTYSGEHSVAMTSGWLQSGSCLVAARIESPTAAISLDSASTASCRLNPGAVSRGYNRARPHMQLSP